jgi:drug/metabolite transporter (DMT)-like permease
LGFGGVVLVMVARIGAGGKADTPYGVALLCVSIVSLTASTIVFKKLPSTESPLAVVAVQYGISSAIFVPAVFIMEPPWKIHANFNAVLILSFLYLVIFSTLIGQFIWQVMLARGEASVLTSYFFLTPIFGLILATLFLHENFGSRDGIGLLAVVVGITVIARSKAAVAKPVPLAKK